MKKHLSALILLALVGAPWAFSGEVEIDVSQNAKFYNAQGKRIVLPKGTEANFHLYDGEAIVTDADNQVLFEAGSDQVLLQPNSTLVLQKISDYDVQLYLVEGVIELNHPESALGTVTVFTPTSKAMANSSAMFRVTSLFDRELVESGFGSIYCYDSLRGTLSVASPGSVVALGSTTVMSLKAIESGLTADQARHRLGIFNTAPQKAPVFASPAFALSESFHFPDPVAFAQVKDPATIERIESAKAALAKQNAEAEKARQRQIEEQRKAALLAQQQATVAKHEVETAPKKPAKPVKAQPDPVVTSEADMLETVTEGMTFGAKVATYLKYTTPNSNILQEVINDDNIEAFSVRAIPYVMFGNFTLAARAEFGAERVESTATGDTWKFKFAPGINFNAGIPRAISSIAQFIDTIKIGKYLFISRDLDFPLEPDNLRPRKFSADNYHLPAYLNADLGAVKLRVFHGDLLFDGADIGFNPQDYYMQADFSINGKPGKYPFALNFGAFHVAKEDETKKVLSQASLIPRVKIKLPFASIPLGLSLNAGLPLDFQDLKFGFDRMFAGAALYYQDPDNTYSVLLGADFNKGAIYTGQFAGYGVRNYTFDGALTTKAMFVMPYAQASFNFGWIDLDVAADVPFAIGANTPKVKFRDSFNAWAQLGLKPFDGLRVAAKKDIGSMFRSDAQKNFWTFMPEIALEGAYGPLFSKLEFIPRLNAFTNQWEVQWAFFTSMQLGTDYVFSPSVIHFKQEKKAVEKGKLRFIFNAGLHAKTEVKNDGTVLIADGGETGENAKTTTFSMIPYVGVQGEYFTVIGKLPTFDFKGMIDDFKDHPVKEVLSFVDELDLFGFVNYTNPGHVDSQVMSHVIREPFDRGKTFDVRLWKVAGIKFYDFENSVGFIDDLIKGRGDNTTMPFEANVGWFDEKVKAYLNFYGGFQLESSSTGGTAFKFDGFPSLYVNAITKSGFALQLGFSTPMIYDKNATKAFEVGLFGENKDMLVALGMRYDKGFRAGATIAFERGKIGYLMVDQNSVKDDHDSMHFERFYDVDEADLTNKDKLNRVVADINFGMDVSDIFSFDVSYILPFQFGADSLIAKDRISANLKLDTGSFEAYAGFGWRQVMNCFKPNNGVKFSDNSFIKAGLKTKSDWGSVEINYRIGKSVNSTIPADEKVNKIEIVAKIGLQ